MSRTISDDVLDALAENQIKYVHLLRFTDGDYTYRYTTANIPIYTTLDSTAMESFIFHNFSFENVQYSLSDVVDSIKVKIDNRNQVLSSIFLESTMHEEEASIWIAILDENNQIIGTTQIFKGFIADFQLNSTELSVTITSKIVKWDQTAYNKSNEKCRWKKFKGEPCGYSGSATWCDRTYKRCAALSNTTNFGGFPEVRELQDKQIQWGPDNRGV